MAGSALKKCRENLAQCQDTRKRETVRADTAEAHAASIQSEFDAYRASHPDAPPPPPPPPPDRLIAYDPCTDPDPVPKWRSLEAVDASRYQWFSSGGPDNKPFRRMTVQAGDDQRWNNDARAELGKNDWRNTFATFGESAHTVVDWWLRLPPNYPLDRGEWSSVTQFKQAQPSNNGSGSPVLCFYAFAGKWRLNLQPSPDFSGDWERWSAAASLNTWTNFKLETYWSQDPAKGWVSMNGSPRIYGTTLKREVGGSQTGIKVGDSIPGHMRIGLYHDKSLPTASTDTADVKVSKAA